MRDLSIIILAKNEANVIFKAISSAQKVSDDIIVVDSGSTDGTQEIVRQHGVRLLEVDWSGFGATRNNGANIAKYDYVFCLDADEYITDELASSIAQLNPNPSTIYGCKRKNFIGGKEIKFGEWGDDAVYRLYHRNHARWNLADVHEQVVSDTNRKQQLAGPLLHFTTDDIIAYRRKLKHYAVLSAHKFYKRRLRTGALKAKVSPVFSFIKNYIFKLGFLDGRQGFQLAAAHAHYTLLKYRYLLKLFAGKPLNEELNREKDPGLK